MPATLAALGRPVLNVVAAGRRKRGQTPPCGIEPRGDYVFGVVGDGAMRSRRGRERRLVEAGQLVAWDPSGPHWGAGVDGRAWSTRLMVIEVGDLLDLVADSDRDPLIQVEFPQPVLSDPALVNEFRRLHAALQRPTTRLEREERLARWLAAMVDRGGSRGSGVVQRPGTNQRYVSPWTTFATTAGETSAWMSWLRRRASASSVWSGSSATAPAFPRTRCSSPTGSEPHADCSRPAARSPRSPPRPASPTRATCIVTSSAASA